jgi:transposase InsO family protein
MQYNFIKDNLSIFSVEEMCECFGLSRSGYYDWSKRSRSARSIEDEKLKTRIKALYQKAKGRYGHRPIYQHLQDEQIGCGRDRTLRLMKQAGIAGVQSKGFKPQSTDSNHQFGYSPNLLKQLGKPERCDQVWVSDTTYLRTEAGWTYLATVMDLCSRRIIGWSVSSLNDSTLVCHALQSAVMTRGGHLPSGLIHHSDRGSTYATHAFIA